MDSALAPKRTLIWFESHLGAGDAKLSYILAKGLARHGHQVYLASSSIERWPDIFVPTPGIHYVNLPSLDRREDQKYITPDGREFPKDVVYVAKRKDALLTLFHDISPSAVITQAWPLVRSHFDDEMLALTHAADVAIPRPLLACYPCDATFIKSDELGNQDGRKACLMDVLKTYDGIIVPGDAMLDVTEITPPLKHVKDKIHYAGYMMDDTIATPSKIADEVVVCSGGGWRNCDLPFYLGMIHSRAHSQYKNDVWRIKVSTKLCPPAAYTQIVEAAKECDSSGEKIIIEPSDAKFRQQMVDAKAIIIRSGYNTLVEAVATGKPVLTIPRPYKGMDREQGARAAALQKLGYVSLVSHEELLPLLEKQNYASLAHALDSAGIRHGVDMKTQGADNAAMILDFLREKRDVEIPHVTVMDASGATALSSEKHRNMG